ncbi:hypothetical protein SAY86_015402 [Trapa natans]|uniref:Uncharacterized protein n=1 Tax=Trapa natans TaxID=22666 RepID=A0AAN7KJU7_TRANT|nr:hypothetical protein SAY86_015402 [Trapa natans]
MSEFEAELKLKRKMADKAIEAKQRLWELRELDFHQLEDLLKDKEHEMEIQFKALAERENDISERSNDLSKREKSLVAVEQEIELKHIVLQKEKEQIYQLKRDLERSMDLLEDKKKLVDRAQDKLEAMKTETDELSVLEIKLKEELDRVRAEKLEIMSEADKLKIEKVKFENEWVSIDEKREELRKEAERVAEERIAISMFLKEERGSLRIEKDAIISQYKTDAELLRAEREEFMNKISQERSEWFSRIQQEQAVIFMEIEMQKKELVNCFDKRREELENSLQEKEKAFEQEKKNQLLYINSLKEMAVKEMEHVASEMRRLEVERMEINMDRERREKEWAELNNSIEDLKLQREKLRMQRELLHADREEICSHIEKLKQLEDVKIASEKMAVAAMQQSAISSNLQKISELKFLNQQAIINKHVSHENGVASFPKNEKSHISPGSAHFPWIKKAADLIFKTSSERSPLVYKDESIMSEIDGADMPSKRQSTEFAVHSEWNPEINDTLS